MLFCHRKPIKKFPYDYLRARVEIARKNVFCLLFNSCQKISIKCTKYTQNIFSYMAPHRHRRRRRRRKTIQIYNNYMHKYTKHIE